MGGEGLWLDLGEYHGPAKPHAFLMYSAARHKARAAEEAYRVYVTDSLMLAPQAKYLTTRFADVIMPESDFDPEEVIDRVARAIGGEAECNCLT